VRIGCALGLLLALVWLGTEAQAQTSPSGATTSGHRCLIVAGSADTPFVRDFNPFGHPLDFTWGGIYEPLVVVTNSGGGHQYDWLASALDWSKDGRTLTLTVRHGVTWSDGKPLTSRDVLYTLTAGRQDRDMDQIGLTQPGNEVASIELVGSDKVAIHLKARDSSFVAAVLANNLRVVPEHIFSRISHVSAWMNPNPVGTGPFAVVQSFGDQGYVLARNPHYWLAGAPHFPCIERILASSGDSAVLQMVHGDVDLTNNLVTHVEQAYVAHDPQHFHFFYPASSLPVGLFLDDGRYPFSLVAFRKAISLAIDRETVARLAEYGYAPPVDAIGINRIWNDWMDPKSAAEARRLAAYDPAAAKRALLADGFSYRRGTLIDPHGAPVVITAKVIASWSDWVTAWRVIARNLGAIGIHVDVRLVPTWGDWQSDAFSTRVATLLWNNFGNGPTPYTYFKQHLDRGSFIPSGQQADRTGNWEHFQSAEGTRLLTAYRGTFDRAVQRRLTARLERLWLKTLPYVPLFAAPEWSTYSTRHFVGFPSERDFYLRPSYFTSDYVVALTRIRPA
jgi:peptide/nickel transport system substrate-binding protein